MIDSALLSAIKDGGSFVLAAVLTIYVLRDSHDREARMLTLLATYAENIGKLYNAITELKTFLDGRLK